MTEPNALGKVVSAGIGVDPPENGGLDHGFPDASIFERDIDRAGR